MSVSAVTVNLYMVNSHARMVDKTLPVIEAAGRIGSEANLIAPLATALLTADASQDVETARAALIGAVESIGVGMSTLRENDPEVVTEAIETAGRIARESGRLLELELQIDDRTRKLDEAGRALGEMTHAGIDLARLRITAHIAALSIDGGLPPHPTLDALADRHFFTFERLTELASVTDRLRLISQTAGSISDSDALVSARAASTKDLALMNRRISFLPSATGRQRAVELMAEFDHMKNPGGLFDLVETRIGLQQTRVADTRQLNALVADLSARARQAQEAAQAAGLARIARTDRITLRIVATLVVVTLMALVTALVLWFYARRHLVSRLASLSQRIIEVARGSYGAPMPITGRDEIGRMEKAVNVLRRRMQQAAALRDDLEAAVKARTGDVVAEMKAADIARADAEAANERKTEFLARMTHEIRTPLNGVIGMLHLLERETPDPDRRKRVRIAHRSACELRDLADDILDFAGTEVSAARDKPVHFVLRDLVGQMGLLLQGLAANKGLTAEIDMTNEAPPVLYGDRIKIRQIVGNFVSNAVKYTEAGRVTLSVDHATDPGTGQPVLAFAVADTGVSMSREMIERAFDAYTRADRGRETGISGHGLGLAISRNLAEAIGGAISVESQPGVGSRFTLTVPLLTGEAEQVADAEQESRVGGIGAEVLVIDDHSVNRMVARGFLERLGCRVEEARNGREGLAKAGEERFDFVLLDLDLPDMPGAEVAAALRRTAPETRIVALTAFAIDDTPDNRVRLGVSRVLSKPISPRRLAEVLGTPLQDGASARSQQIEDRLREDIADLGEQTTADIVAAFLEDLPKALAAIRETEGETRRKAAHRIKGAAANFGLDLLCGVLADIERHGAARTWFGR